MFQSIRCIDDVLPIVADKKEIRFLDQADGITVGCYLFMDSETFDSPTALECRGIAFDRDGQIVSRPLHKFFNVGEKPWLTPETLAQRNDVVAIFEKLDGSMIATAWVDGALKLRSKKSFTSGVVRLAQTFLAFPDHQNIREFSEKVASQGMTAIFELTHPEARIVVAQKQPELRLLHIRDNVSGAYVMLDPDHPIHVMIAAYQVPVVSRFDGLGFNDMLDTLTDMEGCEGYVIQFSNGDMVKAKCPWYLRLHRSITFLRERDIARLVIEEEIDDVKASLIEAGIDLSGVNQVESRVKSILSGIMDEVESIYQNGRHLERKDFALAYKSHPLFALAIQRYLGKEVLLLDWYRKNLLKGDFGLRVLANETIEEAMGG